jgi:hypothetical protein
MTPNLEVQEHLDKEQLEALVALSQVVAEVEQLTLELLELCLQPLVKVD